MRYRVLVFALALAALLAPRLVSAQSTVGSTVGDIDAFWAQQFANAGLTYASPNLQPVDGPMSTDCGPIAPAYGPGAYCAADDTVYYATAWAPDDQGSEIVWLTVLGHEWGHHIQHLVDTGISTDFAAEQQADCFSGAYMRHAEEIGLISPEAVTQGLSITQGAGDVWYELPPDSPAHGNKAQRAMAFMTGMNGGVAACGFPG
jgi:predicted metalloprotease